MRLAEQAHRPLMSGDQIIQWCRAVGQLGDGRFEVGEQAVEDRRLTQVAVAATRPRMPFTKRPDSSPEKDLASSIDSLIAALGGAWRSIAIAYTAIGRQTRFTFACWSS